MPTWIRAIICALVASASTLAAAQAWPTRPVRLIIPFPPGGNTDTLGRLVMQKLSETMGQQFIVENRAGAGSVIGAEAAARAAPDGYTLFFGTTGSLASQPALQSKLPYDPVKSFSPITVLAAAPVVIMVRPELPVNNLREFIAYAKERPGKLTYGSSGIGHFLHVSGEGFNAAAGVELFHVPYKGTGQIQVDMFAGRLDVMIDTIVAYTDHLRSGKLKGLAAGHKTRLRSMPNIPTTAEAGLPGYEFASYFGLLAPAGTSQDIIRRLNTEVVRIVGTPELTETLNKMGLEPMPGTPEAYASLIVSDAARWKEMVARIGIKME